MEMREKNIVLQENAYLREVLKEWNVICRHSRSKQPTTCSPHLAVCSK